MIRFEISALRRERKSARDSARNFTRITAFRDATLRLYGHSRRRIPFSARIEVTFW